MDAISLWLSAMYNAQLRAYIHSPAYKIEERITFAFIYACLYLAELDDEQDDKYVAANTFDISCVSVGSRYEL